jgi:cyanophycinase
VPITLLLAGSGEFLPTMTAVDAQLLRHTPGNPPRVAIVPTAAGQEASVESWIRDGVRHFSALGCTAYGVRAINRASANDPEHAAAVEQADLIYLSGGSPGYLVETLRGSAVWQAIERARQRGSVLAGSSAGAMAQGGYTLVRPPGARGRFQGWLWQPALGILPTLGVIPHYDRVDPERVPSLVAEAPRGTVVYGIDEDTAVIIHDGAGQVFGRAAVTVWQEGEPAIFGPGDRLPPLPGAQDQRAAVGVTDAPPAEA